MPVLCACGCGEPTRLIKSNMPGRVAGAYSRFITGHQFRKPPKPFTRGLHENEPVLFIPMHDDTICIVDADRVDLARFHWSNSRGYPTRYQNNRVIYMHYEVLPPRGIRCIDHINGNPSDCRRSNLRRATHRQNMQNRKLNKLSTSGFKGVHLDKRTGRYWAYCARVRPSDKVYIGSRDCIEDAARLYDITATARFGSFARLNFPPQ